MTAHLNSGRDRRYAAIVVLLFVVGVLVGMKADVLACALGEDVDLRVRAISVAHSAYSAGKTCWQVVSGPILGTEPASLNAVAAVSPNDIWAVGDYGNRRFADETLIEHWDGKAWGRVESPTSTTELRWLLGVAAVSANDVWAVGYSSGAGGYSRTLTEHWDGRSWTIVPSRDPDPTHNFLWGVAAVSANDVWAVGYYGSDTETQTLIEHWDGTAWTVVPSPYMDITTANHLTGIAAVSANDVWAVGHHGSQTLVEHWNGKSWFVIQTPTGDRSYGSLDGVAVVSANDVWAVGSSGDNSGSQMLIEHWDGTAWTIVPSPNPDADYISLVHVATVSANDIWAAGHADRDPLVAHWDGTAWSVVPVPMPFPTTDNYLYGVAAVSANDVWAVGRYTPPSGSGQPLLVHLGACLPTSTPTGAARPTATPRTLSEPIPPPVGVPGTGSREFPETAQTVTGLFLEYWDTHGRLAQHGYPISAVMGEISDLDGKLYAVQYFERAVFAYHPGARPPYDVQLAQLGTHRYSDKYPHGAPNQRPNTQPGSLFFTETGKRLGGTFLNYWKEHGGLVQQGYPISDEFTEISDLDGKPYLVQYFQRTVFEYHPENQEPYEVLLSQLGTYWHRLKHELH